MEISNILLLAFTALVYFNTCDGCSCWRGSMASSYCRSDYVMNVKIVNYTDTPRDMSGLPDGYIALQYIIRTYDIEIKHLYRHKPSYTAATKKIRTTIADFGCGRELSLDHTYYIAGHTSSYPDIEGAETFLWVGSCNYVVDLNNIWTDVNAYTRLMRNIPTCV